MVKPMLLYNCEVWGSFSKPRSPKLDYFISNMFDDRYYHEALLNKSCKHMLGFHSRSSNDVVRGELGMYPLNVYIYKQIVKFYFHLIDISKQSPIIIIRESLKECESLVNNGKLSWIATVFNLLSLADIKEINRSSTLKQIETTLKSIYEKGSLEQFTTPNDLVTCIQR